MYLRSDLDLPPVTSVTFLLTSYSFRFGDDYLNPQLNHFQPQGGAFKRCAALSASAAQRRDGKATQPASLRVSSSIVGPTSCLACRPRRARWTNCEIRTPSGGHSTRFTLVTIGRLDVAQRRLMVCGGSFSVCQGKTTPALTYLIQIQARFSWAGVRNAFPIANIWSMPAIKFNDNSFIPVTMLRQGLINTSTPPNLNQGIIPLPANTGTTTFPKEPMRKEIHSFNFLIERELSWKFNRPC